MKQTPISLRIALAPISAVLAFFAALIAFVRRGEVKIIPIVGGLFLLALAYYLSLSTKSGSVG